MIDDLVYLRYSPANASLRIDVSRKTSFHIMARTVMLQLEYVNILESYVPSLTGVSKALVLVCFPVHPKPIMP